MQGSTAVYEYAPIAKALHKLDDGATGRLKRKFDVAYLIAKQNLAFSKMTPLCELEERHGVDLGESYKNSKSCAVFTDYIAKDLQTNLVASLSKVRYFSLQADSSTDCGNIENEVFLAVYFDPYSTDGRVHVRNQFFTGRRPERANADDLFACLNAAMQYVAIRGCVEEKAHWVWVRWSTCQYVCWRS